MAGGSGLRGMLACRNRIFPKELRGEDGKVRDRGAAGGNVRNGIVTLKAV